MAERTERLSLPLLASGQAQKELTHNEALTLLDMLVQPVVLSADVATPPGTPDPGACWIVPAGATGAWSDKTGQVAMWTAAGWRFAVPHDGWQFRVADRSGGLRYDGIDWIDTAEQGDGIYVGGHRVIAERQPAIASPSGGQTVDSEARTAIAALLAAARAHGLIAS